MKLDHPNVLLLFGTTSGFGPFPAMVCPWLENGTLTSYLERHGVGLELMQLLTLVRMIFLLIEYVDCFDAVDSRCRFRLAVP